MVNKEKQSQLQLVSQDSLIDIEDQKLENIVGGNVSTAPLLGGAKHLSDMKSTSGSGSYKPPQLIQAPSRDTLKAAGVPGDHDSVLNSLRSTGRTLELNGNKIAVRQGVYLH